MYGKLPPNIWFQTGKGDKIRKIDVGKIFCALGELRSSSLLGFHAFTGSDVTGKFAGRSKEFCFKIFLSCNEDILIELRSLGNTLSEDDCKALERFVCILYKYENHTNVSEFRWYLYCHREAQAESLPPTQGGLKLHIMRAHYVSKIWKSSRESIMSLPPIKNFEWEKDEHGFISPVRCSMPPAPVSVINLVKCGCRTGCSRNCSCHRNQISCTELCKYFQSSCNNSQNRIEDDVFVDNEDLL